MAVDGDCDTFCWWEASDVFEEGGMPQSEFSGTYGLLTLNGLPKATFNAFRFLNRLRGGRLELRHEALAPGCGLVATAEGESLQVLLWHRDLSAYGVGDAATMGRRAGDALDRIGQARAAAGANHGGRRQLL